MPSTLQNVIANGTAKEKARLIIENNVNYSIGKKTLSDRSINRIYNSCTDTEYIELENYIKFASILSNFRFQLYSIMQNIKLNTSYLERDFYNWINSLDMARQILDYAKDKKVQKDIIDIALKSGIYDKFFRFDDKKALIITDNITNQSGQLFIEQVKEKADYIVKTMQTAKGWVTAIEETGAKKNCIDIIPSDIAKIIEDIKTFTPENKLLLKGNEEVFFNRYGKVTEDKALYNTFCIYPIYSEISYNEDCYNDALIYLK